MNFQIFGIPNIMKSSSNILKQVDYQNRLSILLTFSLLFHYDLFISALEAKLGYYLYVPHKCKSNYDDQHSS